MSRSWMNFSVRSFISILGITFISFGAALSEFMDMGLDPFTAMNRAISSLLGLGLGNFQLFLNLLGLLIIFSLKPSLIGWGSVYGMILIGYQVDFFGNMLKHFLEIESISFLARIMITIFAISIFSMGVALYMDINFGLSAYDAIAPLIEDKMGWNYTLVRIGQDLIVIFIAFLFNGPVGISTIITGFFAGPLIAFFSKRISKPLIENLL